MPSVATAQVSIRHPSFGALLAVSIFLPFLADQSSQILIPTLLAALSFAVFLTAYSLWHLRKQHQGTDRAFRQADCEFASVFENVLDGILIVDDTGDCLDANPAAAAILRLPGNELIGQNVSRFLKDAGEFAQGWKSFVQQKNHRGCTKLIAGDHTTVFVAFTATAQYLPGRNLLILCELEAVEAARAEVEALRRATLALSQNLAMDSVLDTLLKCIRELIPFDKATVLFAEQGQELLVAREAPRTTPSRIGFTLKASENIFLECALSEKKAMLLSDVARETDWRSTPPLDQLRSWLGIPLLAAGHVQGILSLGAEIPAVFTAEHLRLAKSLAIPAAVAIQNARTHQRAEIYAAELEARLKELRETQKALEHVERKTLPHYEQ